MKPHRHMMSFASPVTLISFIRKEHHMPMSTNCKPTDTVYGTLPVLFMNCLFLPITSLLFIWIIMISIYFVLYLHLILLGLPTTNV